MSAAFTGASDDRAGSRDAASHDDAAVAAQAVTVAKVARYEGGREAQGRIMFVVK